MKKKFPWLELIKHFVTAVLTFLASIGVNQANEPQPVEIKHTTTDTVILQMQLPEIPDFDTVPITQQYFSPSKFKNHETLFTWPSQKLQTFPQRKQRQKQNTPQINHNESWRLLAVNNLRYNQPAVIAGVSNILELTAPPARRFRNNQKLNNMATKKATLERKPWLYNSGIPAHNDYQDKNREEVLTSPNMAFTIPEIIARFEKGQSVPVKVEQHYTGDAENLTGEDIRTWDISELYDYAEKLSEKAKAAEFLARQQASDKKLKADQKAVLEKLKARVKAETDAAGQALPDFVQKALDFKD